MYTYENAIVKLKNSKGRWVEENLSSAPVASLFNTYLEVFLVLSHPSLDHQVSLDLREVSNVIGGLMDSVTVSNWLEANGNNALPTRDEIPTVTTKLVKYNDAKQGGFDVKLVLAFGHPDTEIMDTEKDDFLLTKAKVDYALFNRSVLTTVNGLIHFNDYSEYGIRVYDAGKSFRQANNHHCGLLSFREVGNIKCIPITPEMVYHPSSEGKLSDAAYIALPEKVEGKIVMMVIGGYLHMLDSYYTQVGPKSIKVDMANLPFIDRFYASKKLLDFSTLYEHLSRDPSNDEHFAIAELFSDEVIRAYLSLSQSFVVILDADNLYVEKHKLAYSHLPGRYYSHFRPEWPLRTEMGRLPEYIAIGESDVWVLAVQDNFSTKYRYKTVDYEKQQGIDNARDTFQPVYYSQGHLLEIGTDIQAFDDE